MAVYGNMVLTQQGLALYSKAQSGVQLNFTRMQIGSGQLPQGQDPTTLTALITPITYFSINSVSSSGNTAYVKGIFENTSIAIATYSCELGLFATDPIAGEILYAYANAGSQGDTIPPISAGPLSEQYQINVAIGNASSITATIPSNTYVLVTSVGQVGGVAGLDNNGKVPTAQLPPLNYIPIGVEGQPGGVATLDQNGHVTSSELPVASTTSLGVVKAGSGMNVASDGTLSGNLLAYLIR